MSHGALFAAIERCLVLAPHTDDEMGCAGTMVRLLAGGTRIRYVAFSRCEESVPEGFPSDVLEHEARACNRELGLGPDDVTILRHPVRHFPAVRQEILEYLYALNKDWRPQLVLLPCSMDRHQDHATVSAESVRAFKNSTLLGYELPLNNRSFESSAFVRLDREHLDVKIRALAQYRSQTFRSYLEAVNVEALARVRGGQCGALFAEAFEAIKVVL